MGFGAGVSFHAVNSFEDLLKMDTLLSAQNALPRGRLWKSGRSRLRGVCSGRRDSPVTGVQQRGRGGAARVRGGTVWRCGVDRPPSRMADRRGGTGGGGGSSFDKKAGATETATTEPPSS